MLKMEKWLLIRDLDRLFMILQKIKRTAINCTSQIYSKIYYYPNFF